MEFASEMVVRASLAGCSITEVPTTLRPDGRSRPPHLRTWRDGWRHLRFLLAFSPRWLMVYPPFPADRSAAWAAVAVLRSAADRRRRVQRADDAGLRHRGIAGVQTLGLAIVSRSYAAHLGLLPPSERLESWLERVTLERGLIIGLVAVVLGIAAFVVALVRGVRRASVTSTR